MGDAADAYFGRGGSEQVPSLMGSSKKKKKKKEPSQKWVIFVVEMPFGAVSLCSGKMIKETPKCYLTEDSMHPKVLKKCVAMVTSDEFMAQAVTLAAREKYNEYRKKIKDMKNQLEVDLGTIVCKAQAREVK